MSTRRLASLGVSGGAGGGGGGGTPTSTGGEQFRQTLNKVQSKTAHLRAEIPSATGNSSAENGDGDAASLTARVQLLERDLERRTESYIKRERAYKTRIGELEQQIGELRDTRTSWMNNDPKMQKLRTMHEQVQSNISLVQDRTAQILQEQERDLLRAFRARLFDVQTELEKERSKKDDGAGAWIERARQLEAELDWAKEVADRLERVNQSLGHENGRLKQQFKSQEEDRNFLIHQLVSVKKDNARLRQEVATATEKVQQMEASGGGGGGYNSGPSAHTSPRPPSGHRGRTPGGTGGVGGTGGAGGDSDMRFREMNKRLRRLLAEEKRSLQQVRQSYAAELRSRTELELLLRRCVEDVRKEIVDRRVAAAADAKRSVAAASEAVALEEFTPADRERTLELLLSQERVITLLYSKTFPIRGASQPAEGGAVGDPNSVLNAGQDGVYSGLAASNDPLAGRIRSSSAAAAAAGATTPVGASLKQSPRPLTASGNTGGDGADGR